MKFMHFFSTTFPKTPAGEATTSEESAKYFSNQRFWKDGSFQTLSWWRRIKSLQRNIFLFSEISLRFVCKKSSWRHLEEGILQTHTEDVLKMSWGHLWKTSCKHVLKRSGGRFEYVLGNEKIYYSHQCMYGWESMLSYFNKNYIKSGSHV